MSSPFEVTVVIPVRDGLPDVLEAIESVFHQSLQPTEIVVVDDDSQDGSGDLIERRYGHRVRLLRGHFGGAAAARNAGLRAAKTEFVAFLDADDLWFSEKLAVAGERFAAAPAASWFFSDGAFRTIDGQLHASWFAIYAHVTEPYCGSPLAQLFEVNFVLTSSVVARRSALEAVGGFDERLSHGEDLDLWIRLARAGLATASRRALVRYQHRGGGLTRQTENRLRGGLRLFEALALDTGLSPDLRRRARRRASHYHQRLGLECLRARRRRDAWREFAAAWMFPGRVTAPLFGMAAALLPDVLFEWLRRMGPVAASATPMFKVPKVVLRGFATANEPALSERARRENGS